MVRKRTLALICGIAWLAVPLRARTGAVDLSNAAVTLNAAENRFLRYGQDFAKDAANHAGNEDALIYFQEIAGNAQDEAHACRVLLDIYGTIQSKSDRDAIRPIIAKEFGIHALSNKLLLKVVDLYISKAYASNSSVGAEASRMRTDLDHLTVTEGLVALALYKEK